MAYCLENVCGILIGFFRKIFRQLVNGHPENREFSIRAASRHDAHNWARLGASLNRRFAVPLDGCAGRALRLGWHKAVKPKRHVY